MSTFSLSLFIFGFTVAESSKTYLSLIWSKLEAGGVIKLYRNENNRFK